MKKLKSILVREDTWKRAYWWCIRGLLLFCLYCLADGMYQFVEWLDWPSGSSGFMYMFHD